MTMPPPLPQQIVATAALRVDSGTISSPAQREGNAFSDEIKGWAPDVLANMLVRLTTPAGRSQLAVIDGNSATSVVIKQRWAFDLPIGSSYEILVGDLMQMIGDVLGGGVGILVPMTIDPFTNTGNIDPAVVRSSATVKFRALKVHIHWSAATSNPVTIALDSHQGAAYDTVLEAIPLGANTDLVYYFPANAVFEAGDAITIAWTDDTGGLATWGVEIGWEGLG
ncbi:MAG: hypothetical protein ACOC58_00065 [Chloroflexota bacterium]